jgi:hypothetical protein
MKVNSIQCPICKEVVFSRTRHDLRYCGCGCVGIDGGREYTKINFHGTKAPAVNQVEIYQTPAELYNDWRTNADNFGRIKH